MNSPESYLLLNTHFVGTGFLPRDFTVLILIGIQDLLDRKMCTSDTADIFHKFTIGLDFSYLRISGSLMSVKI